MNRPDSSTPPAETRLFAEPSAAITAILPLDDDPNLRAIHVDGKSCCVVRSADVDDLQLSVDSPWSDSLARDVEHRAALVDARQRALRLLGRKAYSSVQLRQKLEPNVGREVARAAVAELVDDGWVDDRAVAQDIVSAVLDRGPAGARLLAEKLRRGGIDEQLAEDVIATALQGDDQYENAVEFIAKHAGRDTGDSSTLARRLSQRLARRGLDEDLISRALEGAGLNCGDHDPAERDVMGEPSP